MLRAVQEPDDAPDQLGHGSLASSSSPLHPPQPRGQLSKRGRHREAAVFLPELRELAAAHGGALDRLRLRWVEGRVTAGLGEHERARQLFTSIRQAFLDDRNPFEAAFQEAAHREAATAELAREVAASLTRV